MRTPSATTTPPTSNPDRTGNRNWSRRLTSVDFRQASSGPMPVSSSSIKPIGTIHWLKNGGPTVMRSPVTRLTERREHRREQHEERAQNSRIQLLNMNAASRDTQESSSLRARSSGSR